MIIGINCCHLSDKTDGAKTRLVSFYSVFVEKNKKTKFIFFVPNNLNIIKFKKNFNSPNVFFHKLNIQSDNIIRRFITGLFYWSLIFKKYNLDYFDQSYLPLFILFKGKTKIILTIHDLRYLHFSTEFFYRYLIFKPVIKLAIFFSDKLVTVSKNIKYNLEKITKKKIFVLSNFINSKSNYEFTKKNKENFIFTVGHSEKRKNLDNLIKAFMYVKLNGYKGNLIICTNQGSELKKLETLILNHAYTENIKLMKKKSNKKVFNLYKQCEIFVLPSLYEGFGIPILEASHYNKVIVLSSIPVFKEITFNKLIYFDPTSPKKISEKIMSILNNKSKQKKLMAITKKVNNYYSQKKILNKFNKLFI